METGCGGGGRGTGGLNAGTWVGMEHGGQWGEGTTGGGERGALGGCPSTSPRASHVSRRQQLKV